MRREKECMEKMEEKEGTCEAETIKQRKSWPTLARKIS